MKILDVKNVSYIYHSKEGETLAIDDLSFDVDEGELVSVVGPSGCGKSTLLSILSRLLTPSSGQVYIDGKPIDKGDCAVSFMPQRDQLFGWRSIIKNVVLGLEIKGTLDDAKLKRARSLLEKYGLKDSLHKKPAELSGGMRQRVALIRTLMTDPKLLLLDEPFAALDFQTRIRVVEDVHNIIKSENKTALLVTHDISEAISLSDKIVVLTSRPAKVKRILNVEIDKSLTPLERREASLFPTYFDTIWRDLNNHD